MQVSWIRLSDLNLLTVGRYTYTSDLRFEGIHQKYSPDWKLVLNGARISDSGIKHELTSQEHLASTTRQADCLRKYFSVRRTLVLEVYF